MRMILMAGAVLALSACGGGGDTQANGANAMGAENMAMDQNMMMDTNMTMDPNMSMNGSSAMGGNAAGDANMQDAMAKDAATNDPDTNLANGM